VYSSALSKALTICSREQLDQVVVFAGRLEAREGWRIAAIVGRAMVAELVEHQHLGAAGAGQPFVEAMQKTGIKAAPVGAQTPDV
jgi:hypothetical protein